MKTKQSNTSSHAVSKKSGKVEAQPAPKAVQPSAELLSVETSSTAQAAAPSTSDVATSAPSGTLAARVARAVEALEAVQSALALGGAALSPDQVRRSLKLKKGGERYIPQLARLSAQYGVEVPSRPTAAMSAALAQSQELEPLREAIAGLSAEVEGTYTTSRSETWTTATSLYSMLKKGGTREPKLGAALQPLQAYFSNRHPSATPGKPKVSAVEKAQAKAQARIAKLQQQLATLQASLSSPAPAPASTSEQEQVAPAPNVAPGSGAHATS